MLKPFLLCGILLVAGGLMYNSFGQGREFYPFRKYSQAHGLSSYNITKIVQDQNGFIWISTQDGLNCFDGKTFLVFNKQKDPGHQLKGNTIMDMTEDRKRRLIWLVTSYGGLQAIDIDTRSIHPLDEKDQTALDLKDKWLHSVAITGDLLWIGTYSGLYRYNLATHNFLGPNPIPSSFASPDSLKVGRLISDPSGHCWAFCDGQGILVFDGKTGRLTASASPEFLNLFDSKKELRFWNACLSAGQEVLACTNWGLRRLSTQPDESIRLDPGSLPGSIVEEEVFSAVVDTGRNIWVSDAHHLYKLDHKSGRLSNISERDYGSDAWQTAIYALHIDGSGRLWVGSEEGLSYFSPVRPAFEKFYRSHNGATKIQHAFSICPYNDTLIYCGAANGIYAVNTSTDAITQLSPAPSCYLIGRLTAAQLLVSNSQGLFILRDNKTLLPARQVYPELQPLEADLLCAMVRCNDSIVLLGSELRKGLYVWNTKKKKIKVYDNNNGLILDDGLINGMYRDNNGKAWILTVNSVSSYDPLTGAITNFPIRLPNSLASCNILFDMCETRDGYWLAAYGMGLVETDRHLKVKRIISDKNGLCNNGVYKVFSSGDSLILISSNDGLSVLNIRKNTIKNYFEPDGLHSNAFEQFCGFGTNDTIYAGGVNGFTRIYPRNFLTNPAPPRLYITDVKIAAAAGNRDTAGLGLTHLDIPSDAYQATVFFSGINLSNPERTVYAYRIKELNDNWSNLGGQNFINLIGLNPGRYTLQIRAANEDGVWNASPITLSLRFLPKWYQTIAFELAVIALVAGLLFAFYRYRISQLQRQQQIRREIAGDLHDDLGSTLNTVKVLTHLAKRDPRREEHLDKIEESLTAASSGLRDMIWVLDDSADSFQGLIDRIKRTVLPVIAANEIQLDCCVEDDAGETTISKAEKRNLLLIAKEAVNNSIKYAGCRNIRIHLRLTGNKPTLHIHDDGDGFDPDTVQTSEGNGLRNIRHRAGQINYHAIITSAPGRGTLIEIRKK